MDSEKLKKRIDAYRPGYVSRKTGLHINTIRKFCKSPAGSDHKISTIKALENFITEETK